MPQSELQQIDEELAPLRNEKGYLPLDKELSWFAGKGAIIHRGGNQLTVIMRMYDGKLLYEHLQRQLDVYKQWRKNGKKTLSGNFGINEHSNSKQEDKVTSFGRNVDKEISDEDIPF